MDGVAKTSLLTAAMRAVETERSDAEGRLFSDPYAGILAGGEGRDILRAAIEVSGEQPAIAIRTAFIDEKMQTALTNGVKQIVMLAAGMDTRAYRLGIASDIAFFELDRSEVLAYKKSKLHNINPSCTHYSIGIDLTTPWTTRLKESGFKASLKTLWVVEGLLMYLNPDAAVTLLGELSEIAKPGDSLLCDIMSQSFLESPFMAKQLEFLASLGAPWKFGDNEPETLLKKFGWDAKTTQPGEFKPDRWPFPIAPRHVPNLPRGFYVEAVKL